jgi:serine phosphatase RsbU (regulator of sigma subunit)
VRNLVVTGDAKRIGSTVETEGVRADGSEFPLELSLGSWETRDGTFFTALVRDISERKEAEAALAGVYETEHRIAETLQTGLLPTIDSIVGVDTGTIYVPAIEAASVGGDFYDAFEIDDGRVAILVGDVAGKRVEAAALTLSVRSAVRTAAERTSAPAVILGDVGRALMPQLSSSEFVTAFLAVIDPATGEIIAASAGHPIPLVHADEPRHVEMESGPPLGVVAAAYPEHRFALGPDESLLLYTDGLSEARYGGEMFGEEGILAAAGELSNPTPQDLAEHVLEAAKRHARGTLQDDVAIITARRAR